jgi:sulfur-oxidizing protein SoxX
MLVAAAPGDPQRGYAVVIRQTSTCTLCHAGPFPNPHLQGTVGPDLHGVGARLDVDAIRARLVDASAMNPDTVMPSFGTVGGRTRVGAQWQDKPILSPQKIEDAVAYLAGLR